MAQILDISSTQLLELDSINSKVIVKTFGRKEDVVELHIYDINDNLLYSEENFQDYSLNKNEEVSESTSQITSNKEPSIVNSNANGAGERLYDQPGPNGSTEGYYFNNGETMIWVSTLDQSPSMGETTNESSNFQIHKL